MKKDFIINSDNVIDNEKPFFESYNNQPAWPWYVKERKDCPFLKVRNIKFDKRVNFYQGDSESAWRKNRKRLGTEWYYYDTPVQYTLNSDGFRTYEWNDINWKDSIVILGCSNTFGIAVDDSDTISAQLEKMSGRQVVNLGFPGGSNQYITYLLTQIYRQFDSPTHIVCNYSTIDRNMYFHETGVYHAGPWGMNDKSRIPSASESLYRIRSKDHYFNNFYNPINAIMQAHSYAETNKALCKDRSKLLEVSYFPDAAYAARVDYFHPIETQARDLGHPGRDCHKDIAEWINEQL